MLPIGLDFVWIVVNGELFAPMRKLSACGYPSHHGRWFAHPGRLRRCGSNGSCVLSFVGAIATSRSLVARTLSTASECAW
jgi:hypothetical protein